MRLNIRFLYCLSVSPASILPSNRFTILNARRRGGVVRSVRDLSHFPRQHSARKIYRNGVFAPVSSRTSISKLMGDTSRYGIGISQNGRPVIFPGKTLINVAISREDSRLSKGDTTTSGEVNPLRLISVSKNGEGYTIVEAEF